MRCKGNAIQPSVELLEHIGRRLEINRGTFGARREKLQGPRKILCYPSEALAP
jgi:hypothetical protein